MFKLSTKRGVSEVVRSVFASPIPYEVRVPSANWSEYFGHYQNQKWSLWDSNSCWCLSAVNCLEDQLEWLNKNGMFSDEARAFFVLNGYIDEDGDFSISERFLEVLSGNKDNGGEQMKAWRLMLLHGCIPRDMLTYTQERAQSMPNKEAFNADYFNPNVVTQKMRDLGLEFLKHVKIERQYIGDRWETPPLQYIKGALRQAPLHIGVPVPYDVSKWNSPFIEFDGKIAVDHAIQLYGIDDEGNYLIFDQYLPNLKKLSKDYYLPIIVQGVVSAAKSVGVNPIKQHTIWNKVWTAVNEYWNRFSVGKIALSN